MEYSTVVFSNRNRSQRGSEERLEITETEYAELQKLKPEGEQDDDGGAGGMLEHNEEEVVMFGQENETKQCQQLGEGPVYSSVDDLMADI